MNLIKKQKRIELEIEDLKKEGILLKVLKKDSQEYIFKVKLVGPPDTAFEGGSYILKFNVKLETYPFSPPSVKMLSKIFHPNISQDSICLDILSSEWTCTYTTSSVVRSIQLLLSTPNPDSPLDSDAANAYKGNPKSFKVKNQTLIKENNLIPLQ